MVKKALILIGFLLLLVSCSNKPATEDTANKIIEHLLASEFEIVYEDFFASKLQESMTQDELKEQWETYIKSEEEFQGITELEVSRQGEDIEIVEGLINFVTMDVEIRFIFNEKQRLVGINFSEGEAKVRMPNIISEEKIIVGAGTDYELDGILTLPKDKQEELPAVVLVHGSGPSDKDETAFGYKPFRDIAWGLAEQGIASVRYDKRTFTYGKEMQALDELTIYEESVEDAIFATELLKEDSRIDAASVYLVGHSLGGVLAPRIEVQGGDYAGLIILAGTPRPLWEIIYDQNIHAIEHFLQDESKKKEQQELVEVEYQKAKQLQEISDEEAKAMTVFGVDAYYLKEMDKYDVETLITDIEKPLLIMHGEDDFQVYYEKDYLIWQEILKDNNVTTFKSYPGLNHFFVDYEGPNKGTVAEYENPGRVEPIVIEDIASWILK